MKKQDEIDQKLDQAEELVLTAIRFATDFMKKSVKSQERLVSALDKYAAEVKRIRAELKPVSAPSRPKPPTPNSHGD